MLEFVDLSRTQREELKRRLRTVCPTVIIVGQDIVPDLGDSFRFLRASDYGEVVRYFDTEYISVLALMIGPQLSAREAEELLSRCQQDFPFSSTANLVFNIGRESSLFQHLIDDDRLFYITQGLINEEHFNSLLLAAASAVSSAALNGAEQAHSIGEVSDQLLDACVRLSEQGDLGSAAAAFSETIETLLDAEQVRCLVYDAERAVVWSVDTAYNDRFVETPAAGLVGWVIRTSESLRLDRLLDDPRYDAELDDPEGDGTARFIAEPVLGKRYGVSGVITARRSASAPPFSLNDERALKVLVHAIEPTIAAISFRNQVHRLLQDRALQAQTGAQIFRQEALDSYERFGQEGELLDALPAWLRRSHWMIMALTLAGLIYMCLAEVSEKAKGPALIRAQSKVSVFAASDDSVRLVLVQTGDRVRSGDLLVRLEDNPNETIIQRANQQVRSPVDGVVGDIRVRAGQRVAHGDLVANIIQENGGYELIAFLPGSYGPQLWPGLRLSLKLQGYPDSHEIIKIDQVSSEIIGPRDAARYIGQESAEWLSITGPVVIVRSLLHGPLFNTGGRSYHYRDGMVAEAVVSVRSEPLIKSLIPGLKELSTK